MLHDWTKLSCMVIENARGKKLDGSKGDYDSALYQLISEAYKQSLDEDDRQVMCVLLTLHEAVRKKTSLEKLANLCADFSRTYNPSGVI